MDESRQLPITTLPFSGKSVVYIMSRDQRTDDNHALIAAQNLATKENVPLYVLFSLRVIPTRSQEHYSFMLEGLRDIERSLAELSIPFVIRIGEPVETITSFANEVSAAALFFDFSPLYGLRALVKSVAKEFKGSVTVVDTHNTIPIWILSDKKEFAAHTIRRKVHKNLEKYLTQPPRLQSQDLPDQSPYLIAILVWAGFVLPTVVSDMIFGGSPEGYTWQKIGITSSEALIHLLAAAWIISLF